MIFGILVERSFEWYIICPILEKNCWSSAGDGRRRRLLHRPPSSATCARLLSTCASTWALAWLFHWSWVSWLCHASLDSLMWLPPHLMKRCILSAPWILQCTSSILHLCMFVNLIFERSFDHRHLGSTLAFALFVDLFCFPFVNLDNMSSNPGLMNVCWFFLWAPFSTYRACVQYLLNAFVLFHCWIHVSLYIFHAFHIIPYYSFIFENS